MEEAFNILSEYKKAQKEAKERAEAQKQSDASSQEGQKEKEEIICSHEDQILHEGSYVCTGCGLVMGSDFQPEVNWSDRCVIAREYSATDRLRAVDKHLLEFMQKAGLTASLHPIQERMHFMKKECGYKAINYAIALTCILEDDSESQERLRPYLPKSNVAWARSCRLLKPSTHFLRVWLHRLGENHRPLSKSQLQRFRENVAQIMTQPEKSDLMYRIIRHHGYYGYDLYTLPDELQCILYRFSCAILK